MFRNSWTSTGYDISSSCNTYMAVVPFQMWMPGFMSGYGQQFQCHPSCFFLDSREELSFAVGVCHSCGSLYCSRALHTHFGSQLLFADNRNINICMFGDYPMIQHECFLFLVCFCTDQMTGSRSTSNKYCRVLLAFSNTKTIKGNPSPLGLRLLKAVPRFVTEGIK